MRRDTIVIGHSLGPAFLCNILSQLNHGIKAAFSVAPFISPLNNPDFDKVNKTFYIGNGDVDWEKIKMNCKMFYILHSDNDPYVPIEKAEELAGKLGVGVIGVKDAGHFNEKAGYKKFELLLEKIKEEVSITT